MKYNSIGDQLITKANEIDPNYQSDKFNDMSEAIDIILNNMATTEAISEIKLDSIQLKYNDLKVLRDNSQLIPGQTYIITDYVTTTTSANTRSAGNLFNIIVRADDENHLNENCSFAHSDRDVDGYFAESKIEAWQGKYCLDNDNTRFAWADTENGKGVIYRLKDEYNNEAPYDFKNIIFDFVKSFEYFQWGANWTFIRDTSLDVEGYYGWRTSNGGTPNAWSNPYCFTNTEDVTTSTTLYSDTSGSTMTYGEIISVSMNEFSSYTFSYTTSSVNYDASLVGHSQMCFNNSIREYRISGVLQLNKIVFYKSGSGGELKAYNNTFGNGCYNNTFDGSCYNNTFGNDCYNNTFDGDCHSNTLGNNCYSNTFGFGCHNNTFDSDCDSNTFGSNCQYNTFGNYFKNSTLGSSCNYNTFGNNCAYSTYGVGCSSNTLGNNCYSNTFGNRGEANTFGSNCNSNTFGDDCSSNAFGNSCDHNTVDNDCNSNTFGNSCSSNTFSNHCRNNRIGNEAKNNNLASYARWNIFENGVSYVSLTSEQKGSSSAYLQNITIRQGVAGTNSNLKTITETRGNAFDTTYRVNGAQDKTI